VAGYTKMVFPQTVTHPSINQARRRVTTLIETNALPLSQATTTLIVIQSNTAASQSIRGSLFDRCRLLSIMPTLTSQNGDAEKLGAINRYMTSDSQAVCLWSLIV